MAYMTKMTQLARMAEFNEIAERAGKYFYDCHRYNGLKSVVVGAYP